MKSYNDLNYRTYVLNQFKSKKATIESIIKKHLEELKILEETMDNIKDGKHNNLYKKDFFCFY